MMTFLAIAAVSFVFFSGIAHGAGDTYAHAINRKDAWSLKAKVVSTARMNLIFYKKWAHIWMLLAIAAGYAAYKGY